jgi:hypothetical protein
MKGEKLREDGSCEAYDSLFLVLLLNVLVLCPCAYMRSRCAATELAVGW